MKKIKVVDSIMGSGKTSWAIDYINNNSFGKSYIYITPFLDEVKRVKSSITNKHFYDPINEGNGKLENLKELISEGYDVVSTHALFQKADKELIDLIRAGNYILILDEVMNVIQQVPLKNDDFKLLLQNDIVSIAEDCTIKWNNTRGYNDTKYNNIREMANLGTLMYHRESVLMWTFPVEVFDSFKDVYILTYYFEAQFQKYYYDLFSVEYEYYSVKQDENKYMLIPRDNLIEDRSVFKDLINIYEGKLNDVGTLGKLSKTWLVDKSNSKEIDRLRKNTTNYFKNIIRAKSHECLWTTIKDVKHKIGGKGYIKSFSSCNERATNKYSDRNNLAYILNRYMPVMEKTFLIDKGICVDEDKWALSELLQWTWRSAIRNNQKINIYIPSLRMRKLLYDWLEESI
jgi:hypothetical protein